MFYATESYYKDFFEPPARPAKKKTKKTASDSLAPPRQSQVRFHEEVKVRNIKSRGKGKKLYELDGGDEDENEDGFR